MRRSFLSHGFELAQVQMARQMFFRAAENYSDARESTGVLLNRMAPEIVQAAKQRLEARVVQLDTASARVPSRLSKRAGKSGFLPKGSKSELTWHLGCKTPSPLDAFVSNKVPDYLRNAKDKACTIAVAGNQSPLP